MKALIATLMFIFWGSQTFAATPSWTIDCLSEVGGNQMKIELYQTGHPMAGIYAYSGLIFYKTNILFSKFVSLKPITLEGRAKNLDRTFYHIELSSGLLNTNESLPAALTTILEKPLGGVRQESESFICSGR